MAAMDRMGSDDGVGWKQPSSTAQAQNEEVPPRDAAPTPSRNRQVLRRIWGTLAKTRADGAAPSAARRAAAMAHALLSERGEVSGARVAAELKAAYEALDPSAREAFFDIAVDEFGPDAAALAAAIDAYRADPTPARLIALQQAVEPPRQELLRRFNMAPGGTATLVGMRRDLLRSIDARPERRALDSDLVHLLRSWFNPGFLELRRIDWRTSALTLERIIQYEAVHEIRGWRDLRRRLEADRRCYAFFHRALPDEPIIFIEVALTRGMPGSVQPLLDPSSPVDVAGQATHAIFYSITNCQEGLRGVSFGNFLIKQVVEDLGRELPRLHTFATLSPMPGFAAWLAATPELPDGRRRGSAVEALLAVVRGDIGAAPARLTEELRPELMAWGAHYLLHARRGGAPHDAVARFHLANGARLERLNWKGDLSEPGLHRSLGLTVNYVYRLEDVERNHEAYATQHRVMSSPRFARLAP
jgi:malonyl-CoA decarboxylase